MVKVKGVAMTEKAPEDQEEITERGDPAPAEPVETAPKLAAAGVAARRVSLSLRTLVVGVAFVLLLASLVTMTWLYFGERSVVQANATSAANEDRAEQIALDYAVSAAAMNFQDLAGWKTNLVKGTSPELTDKLSKAAQSMEQLLVPLQWTSTSEPLTAKVRSESNGVYVVDTFVSVLTKTTQAPDNLQSTATYSITIDANNNWLITDVGGIGAVVAGR